MKPLYSLSTLLCLAALPARAQHDHTGHDHAPKKDSARAAAPSAPRRDTVPLRPAPPLPAGDHSDHSGHEHGAGAPEHEMEGHAHHEAAMTHAFSRALPMTRTGSGTSWLPDNAPMYGYMFHRGPWMYMLHGNLFLRYNNQDMLDRGERGGRKFDAPNMGMLMGQRTVGTRGLFRFSAMLSLDPLTVGEDGYPLLFQTGESYKGQPLVDRQHPHDLVSELSVAYTHALSRESDVFLYLGYPGEPAIGPAAFVHRPSNFQNPDAPLSHHWVDATHISFGVATLGYRYRNWKLEGSLFTGREPDEERYGFDRPRFDSWSGRLSFNPGPAWALQASHASLYAPEELHPGEDVQRSTASASWSHRGVGERFTNITAIGARNVRSGHRGEWAALFEGSAQRRRSTLYGRYEWVQKSGEELAIESADLSHDDLFDVHAMTAGGAYDVFRIGQTSVAIGAQLSFFIPDRRLLWLYGDNPVAGQFYLRLYPRAMGRRVGALYLPY